uniref:Uncharacterized protein n=1 Tax=Arundo donax TaxID=35708 RepID=A0A0A9BG78_ARUDO
MSILPQMLQLHHVYFVYVLVSGRRWFRVRLDDSRTALACSVLLLK